MSSGLRLLATLQQLQEGDRLHGDLLGLQRLHLQPQAHGARVLHDLVLGRAPAAHEPPRVVGRGAPRAHARGVAARAGGGGRERARVVRPASAPAPAPAAAREPQRRVATPRRRPRPAAHEILVVVSKLKAYVRERSGMSTSDSVMELLSDRLRRLCDDAIRARSATAGAR